jgi:hypothetical protein
MQQYDIAAKVLIESCRDELIQRLLGIQVKESTLIEELPQETVSVKRSDFPILVTDDRGKRTLVILEIQTFWNQNVPLNLLDYRIRYLLKHKITAISCVLLLRPSPSATDYYKDNEIQFTYHLVKVYEMDGVDIVSNGPLCLLPLVPLMKQGKTLLDKADQLIYKSDVSREQKANMLTSMAILSGLISEDMPKELILRRKDIMIESVAYDIIKQDGISEGIQLGKVQEAREAVLEILDLRFEVVPRSLMKKIDGIEDLPVLKSLHKKAILVDSIEQFKEILLKLLEE